MWDQQGIEKTTEVNRYVSEYYNSTLTTVTNHTATYTYTTATSYAVHNPNINKLVVTGESERFLLCRLVYKSISNKHQ